MRASIKKAIGTTVQDLINRGIKTSFTEKELKELGVEIPEVEINAKDIQEIRKRIKLSQSFFNSFFVNEVFMPLLIKS